MNLLVWLRGLVGHPVTPPPLDAASELRARRIEREREEMQRRLDRINALAVRAAVEGRREEQRHADQR